MVPEHLLRNGRPEDQTFAADELLFRRYIQEHFYNNKIVDASFSFPGPSVNREKFSQPEDALFSEEGLFEGWGILEFPVRSVTVRLEDGQGIGFVFFPKHAPLDDNYSHTEIACEREQHRGVLANPSSVTKKRFRAMLSQRVRVRIFAAS
jgi:hypothetical protein